MKGLVIAAFAGITALASTTPSEAASFNCNRRLTVTEAVICANPGLSNLDSEMAWKYRAALANYPALRSATKSRQVSWLGSRNACGANVACLRNAYKSRIADLNLLDGGPL